MDKLEQLMSMQEELQNKLGYDISGMPVAERTAYIKEYTLHTEHELHEMLAELPFFKPWKQYSDISYDTARKEFVDALHFFINVALALGFSADELLELYMDKNKENYTRQEDTENYKPCVTRK